VSSTGSDRSRSSVEKGGVGILSPSLGIKRAVVTGVAGFIGSHLAEALVRHGVFVTGLDNYVRSGPLVTDRLASLLRQPRFNLVRADLRSCDLAPVLAGSQVVFHQAALAGVRQSWGDRFSAYLEVNVLGTQRLVQASEEAGVGRLVIASSSSVYGPHVGRPSLEQDQLWPASPYGVSKLAAERLALAYASRPGARTSVVALRYFSVYGPRQRPDMWICRVLNAALAGRAVNLYGDGSQRRDFTYVDDVVAANLAAAMIPARSEVINVGGGSPVSVMEVLDLVAEVTGRAVSLNRLPCADGDVSITEASLSKAHRLLGYVPQTDLRTGIERQWAWLTAGPEAHHFSESMSSAGVI
jgi:UDP-glucuronate 4-epimerase